MADYQQFQLLRQGVSVWNQWRREHPETHPDLNGAYLSRTHLSKANLGKADLSGADLSFSDLRGADLSETDLHGANLRSARLHGSNLNRANLRGADLNQAIMAQTILGNINLRMVKGLETINHRGPSTIGIDTVLRSEGNIPEIFLQGTGATDTFIDYVRSLAQHPIEYYTCFISYSSKDQEFAERLHADLQSKGVCCWFAPEDMKIGDKIRSRIDESIRMYDKLLLVLSQHSIASTWVEFEVEMALAKEQLRNATVLFPIRLDNDVLESTMSWAKSIQQMWHIGDFRNWRQYDDYQKAFARLLRDLQQRTT